MARELRVKIVGDPASYKRALGQATQSGTQFGSSVKRLGVLAAAGLGIAGVAAAGAGVKMIGLASDAGEVDSKFRVIFGRNVPKLTRQINKFSKATGTSRFELKEQVADLGALLSPIVKNTTETGKMSLAVAKLATDLGSFNNVPTAEALLAIRSGLVGEAEPLRRFGVLLNEAAVANEAVRLGLVKKGQALTEAQKVEARYSLIMKQTKLAQGDATRTAGSFANQLKRLKAQVRDTATSLGQHLIPAATDVIKKLNRIFRQRTLAAKIRVAFDVGRDAIRGLHESLRKALFGSTTKKPIRLETGRIIEWEETRDPGLVAAISAGLKNADWTEIGRTVGEGISAKIKLTADFIENMLDAVEANSDKIAEIGALIALKIFNTLSDPEFWKKHWKEAALVALTVIPIGAFAGAGAKIGAAFLRPLARLIPEGFRTIFTLARVVVSETLDKLPGFMLRAAQGMIRHGETIIKWLGNVLRKWLGYIPGWVQKAFKISALVTFYSWLQKIWGKIVDIISKIPFVNPQGGQSQPSGGGRGSQAPGANPRPNGTSTTQSVDGGTHVHFHNTVPETEAQAAAVLAMVARGARSEGSLRVFRASPGV